MTPLAYAHPELGETVTAIGGHYKLIEEHAMEVEGRKLLFFTGYALYDTSCCGTGGCGYAVVPGFVEHHRSRENDGGRPVSMVSPVTGERLRRNVIKAIKARVPVQHVNFLESRDGITLS
jgi:hypothetical protein